MKGLTKRQSSVDYHNLDDAIDYIEDGLTILGSVITEERLRSKVEETINDIRKAGKIV